MNGRHLPKPKSWQDVLRRNIVDAIRYGHLPASPCHACRRRYLLWITENSIFELVCSRCAIRWPLQHKTSRSKKGVRFRDIYPRHN